MNRIRSYLAVDSMTSGASDAAVAVAVVGCSEGVYPAYDRSIGRRDNEET